MMANKMNDRPSNVMFDILCWQLVTFGVVWIGYACTFLLQKPLTIVKADLETVYPLDSETIGIIDASILLPYSIVSVMFGSIADKIGPRRTFGYGLIISSVATFPMGSCQHLWQFMALLVISGVGQALCWPSACSLLALWFPTNFRSTIFGWFGTSCFMGGMAGTALAVFMQLIKGWRHVFYPGACISFLLGCIILLLGKEPSARGLVVPGCTISNYKYHTEATSEFSFKAIKSTWNLILVPEVSSSVFCIKAARYALLMWLPYYLYTSHNYSESAAGLASTAFEIGGTVGCAIMGIVVDRWFSGRALLASSIASLGCGLSLIALIVTSSFGTVAHMTCLVIAGALNCGPDIILSGSVATRLGERHRSTAAASGMVNGIGALGTVLEGPLVSVITNKFGWNVLVPLIVIMCFIASISTYKANLICRKIRLFNTNSNIS